MTAVEWILFMVFLLIINAVFVGVLAAIGVTGLLGTIISGALIMVLSKDLLQFFKKLSRGIIVSFKETAAA